jgi:uncharacterized protein (TIGR02271 family)
MDTGRSQFYVNEGDEVFGSDGDKVGKVIAVQNDYVVVEKGWFFPTDYYIPVSAISSYDDGRAYLNVTKDVALNQGWDTEPVMSTGYETTGVAADTTARSDTDYVAADTTISDTTMTEDSLRVPVYEEELTATKTAREVGGARIEKDVVAEEQVLDVPITEERLRVVRRAVDRDVSAADAGQAFEEVIVDVPVRTEEVEVAKRVRVAEEIDIEKEKVKRTERVADTVRREEVHVTEGIENTVTGDDRDVTLPR